MTIDVDVYFNRHKSTFSIRHKGKVIEHTDTVVIKNPRFVVNESGRNRVLREKKKNVHAFVRGEYYTKEDKLNVLDGKKYWKGIYYNPYKHGSFVYLETDQPIKESKWAFLDVLDKDLKKAITWISNDE
tara:strand:+ start:254 stop:640 length:387 start_codon:yes stop_codon:yes gene_type:complete